MFYQCVWVCYLSSCFRSETDKISSLWISDLRSFPLIQKDLVLFSLNWLMIICPCLKVSVACSIISANNHIYFTHTKTQGEKWSGGFNTAVFCRTVCFHIKQQEVSINVFSLHLFLSLFKMFLVWKHHTQIWDHCVWVSYLSSENCQNCLFCGVLWWLATKQTKPSSFFIFQNKHVQEWKHQPESWISSGGCCWMKAACRMDMSWPVITCVTTTSSHTSQGHCCVDLRDAGFYLTFPIWKDC